MATGGILARATDGTVTQTGPGTANQVLTSNGAGAVPTFQAAAASGITQLTGDVTAGPGSGSQASTIGANKVLDTMLRQGVATSVIGRSANSTGNEADIQSTLDNHVMVRRSSVLGFTLEQSIGYWSPMTNGDPVTPELVWDSFGDTISVWTAL